MSLGQLYTIQNEIMILYKQRANSFPTTLLALTCKNLVRASKGAGSGGLPINFKTIPKNLARYKHSTLFFRNISLELKFCGQKVSLALITFISGISLDWYGQTF
jgi:hypothetical protein